MANKDKRNATTITKENRQRMPARGRGKRNLILEALAEAMPEFDETASKDEVERAWFKILATEAINPGSEHFSMCNNLLANKGWPNVKPVEVEIEFNLPEGLTLYQQCEHIMQAVSKGEIPAGHGTSLINSISQMIKVQELTDINERLKELEKKTSV